LDAAELLRAWLDGDEYEAPGGGFMGRPWDVLPGPGLWRSVYRALKPGGLALVFGGTQTFDLTTVALRLAGFEIRDVMMWVYGSGMNKGLDVGKAIDAQAGADREVTGVAGKSGSRRQCMTGDFTGGEYYQTAPATPEATEWDGWNSTLKPAYEPIVVAMRPPEGTFAENALKWGVAGYHIEGGRVPLDPEADKEEIRLMNKGRPGARSRRHEWGLQQNLVSGALTVQEAGRYPANLIHDGSEAVKAAFEASGLGEDAWRYFYCPKASTAERNAGCEHFYWKKDRSTDFGFVRVGAEVWGELAPQNRGRGNVHPTVKPLALLQYLLRLTATPTGGRVLDPFAGSGTTLAACAYEGRDAVGIELSPEAADIARARIHYAAQHLPAGTPKADLRRREDEGDWEPPGVESLPLFEGLT
jgi:site-specific DNA-methyltransferase (adenine-specific)